MTIAVTRRRGDPIDRRIRRVPATLLAYLRALEGIPADGPTEEMRERWIAEEAEVA